MQIASGFVPVNIAIFW